MRIDWIDETQAYDEQGEVAKLMQAVAEQILQNEGIAQAVAIGITLVGGERIQQINQAHRGINEVTDVLSFPMVQGYFKNAGKAELMGILDPEDGSAALGDLVICPQRVQEQAAEYGHSQEREFGYMAAHGLLHLLGYDHETQEERAQMRQREEAALAALHITRE